MISQEHKEIFNKFMNNLDENSKVGLFADSDLDGIGSAIFMEEILKNKRIKHISLSFLDYHKKAIEEINRKILKENLKKIIILDFNIDNNYPNEFEELQKNFDVLLIDHHPLNQKIKNLKGIIKTKSEDCVALNIYNLGRDLFETKKWEWLLAPIMISEFSYLDNSNFNFLKKSFPNINRDDIKDSIPGKTLAKLGSLIIYYKKEIKKAFEIIKNKKDQEIKKIDLIVKKEVKKYLKKFEKEMEKNKGNIVYLLFDSDLEIYNSVTTISSLKEPSLTFIGIDISGEEFSKISLRNQSGNINMVKMAEQILKKLDKTMYGGHLRAAGGMFLKKDLTKVLKKILNIRKNIINFS